MSGRDGIGDPVVKPADPGLLDDLNRRVAELESLVTVGGREILESLRVKVSIQRTEIGVLLESSKVLVARIAALEATVANLRAAIAARGPEAKIVGRRKK